MATLCPLHFTGGRSGVGPFQPELPLHEPPPDFDLDSSSKSGEKFGWRAIFHRRGTSHRNEPDLDGVLSTDNPEQVESQKQLKEIMERGIKL